MKYYTIYIDGIDKTGKDTIFSYIGDICKYKYICNVRGVITQIAYADLYNREYDYDISQQEYCLNVLLTVDYDDWKIRCKLTNEPKINYASNANAFNKAAALLIERNYPVLKINTSKVTAYEAAKQIVDYMDRLNKLNMED